MIVYYLIQRMMVLLILKVVMELHNEPLKLTGFDIGTYTVSAHLSNMFERIKKNTKTSEIKFDVQKETNSVLSQQVEISNLVVVLIIHTKIS